MPLLPPVMSAIFPLSFIFSVLPSLGRKKHQSNKGHTKSFRGNTGGELLKPETGLAPSVTQFVAGSDHHQYFHTRSPFIVRRSNFDASATTDQNKAVKGTRQDEIQRRRPDRCRIFACSYYSSLGR